MKNNLITKLFISFSTIFAILPTNYIIAGSHELEISLQNCDYAKAFAKTVMKKKGSRTLNYYDQIISSSNLDSETKNLFIFKKIIYIGDDIKENELLGTL